MMFVVHLPEQLEPFFPGQEGFLLPTPKSLCQTSDHFFDGL